VRRRWMAATALLAGALLAACAVKPSRIVLDNQAEGEITHVKISWEGGEQHFDIVPPAHSVTVEMTQVSAKGFKVELTLPSGEKVVKDIPATFNPQYSGGVTITVEKDGRIGWQEHFERR